MMQWYLRYEDGTLSGPGTKEEMSAMQDQVDDAIMFSEAIFETRTVTGSIEGGVLTLENVPDGVDVDIKDYDVEGVDESRIETDEDGRAYFQAGG